MTVRLTFSHPSRKRLQAWLDDGVGVGITEHVEHCEKCASRLEELAEEAGDPTLELDEQLGEAIREVFSPPEGLNDRVMQKIDERERADQEMNLIFGLFSIAKDAAELMLPPGTDTDTTQRAIEAGRESDDADRGDDGDGDNERENNE